MSAQFARGFRLHLADGSVLLGAEFPAGPVAVLMYAAPELGVNVSVAVDMDRLLEAFPGASIEYPGGDA